MNMPRSKITAANAIGLILIALAIRGFTSLSLGQFSHAPNFSVTILGLILLLGVGVGMLRRWHWALWLLFCWSFISISSFLYTVLTNSRPVDRQTILITSMAALFFTYFVSSLAADDFQLNDDCRNTRRTFIGIYLLLIILGLVLFMVAWMSFGRQPMH
jgi:hypothetical protein